jgi:hypothetical protein
MIKMKKLLENLLRKTIVKEKKKKRKIWPSQRPKSLPSPPASHLRRKPTNCPRQGRKEGSACQGGEEGKGKRGGEGEGEGGEEEEEGQEV